MKQVNNKIYLIISIFNGAGSKIKAFWRFGSMIRRIGCEYIIVVMDDDVQRGERKLKYGIMWTNIWRNEGWIFLLVISGDQRIPDLFKENVGKKPPSLMKEMEEEWWEIKEENGEDMLPPVWFVAGGFHLI